MPDTSRTRYVLRSKSNGKTELLVATEISLKTGLRIPRLKPLGSFHTRNGAKAYARIHAGSAPILFSVAA